MLACCRIACDLPFNKGALGPVLLILLPLLTLAAFGIALALLVMAGRYVEAREDATVTFARVGAEADEMAGAPRRPPATPSLADRRRAPRLSEAWFC